MAQPNVEKLQQVLRRMPANVFCKDTECRYAALSDECAAALGIGDAQAAVGQTDLDMHDDPKFGIELYKDDKAAIDADADGDSVSEIAVGDRVLRITRRLVRDDSGNIAGIAGAVDVAQAVSEDRNLQQQLERALMIDQDSGANNRRFLAQWKARRLPEADFPVTLIMCDCDGTKRVNETFGREVGDLLVRETAMALIQAMPPTAFCVRLGGDEFLVVCEATDEDRVEGILRTMKLREIDHFVAGEPLSISHGVCTFQAADGFDEALKRADADLRDVKKRRLEGSSTRIGGAGESFGVKTL